MRTLALSLLLSVPSATPSVCAGAPQQSLELDGLLWPDPALVQQHNADLRSEFGASVALLEQTAESATSAWALVGAPEGLSRGAATLFRRTGGASPRWLTQGRHLVDPAGLQPGSKLGASVAIADEVAAAGAPRAEGTGRVFVRRLAASGPVGQASILAPPASSPGCRAFGSSLSLGRALDGTQLMVVGAPESSVPLGGGSVELAGEVHLYARRTQQRWTHRGTFRAPEPRFAAGFGSSVLVAGDIILVGAPGDGRAGPGAGRCLAFSLGGAVLFELAPPLVQSAAPGARYGSSLVRMGESTMAVAAPGAAVVEIFDIGPGGAAIPRQLLAGSAGNRFGAALAAGMGRELYVGEPGAGTLQAGRVARFIPGAGGWRRSGSIQPLAPAGRGEFGAALAASQSLLLVGHPGDGTACPANRPECGAGSVEARRLAASVGGGVR